MLFFILDGGRPPSRRRGRCPPLCRQWRRAVPRQSATRRPWPASSASAPSGAGACVGRAAVARVAHYAQHGAGSTAGVANSATPSAPPSAGGCCQCQWALVRAAAASRSQRRPPAAPVCRIAHARGGCPGARVGGLAAPTRRILSAHAHCGRPLPRGGGLLCAHAHGGCHVARVTPVRALRGGMAAASVGALAAAGHRPTRGGCLSLFPAGESRTTSRGLPATIISCARVVARLLWPGAMAPPPRTLTFSRASLPGPLGSVQRRHSSYLHSFTH